MYTSLQFSLQKLLTTKRRKSQFEKESTAIPQKGRNQSISTHFSYDSLSLCRNIYCCVCFKLMMSVNVKPWRENFER